jgi:hypothetical protein
MTDVHVEGLTRADARTKIIELSRNNRNRRFTVEKLTDGKSIEIWTDGKKASLENGEKIKGQDITIHFSSEINALNYFDDVIIDLIKKQVLAPEIISPLIDAIVESAHLIPYAQIARKYSQLFKIESSKELPGHSMEFIIKIIRWMCLQEDINYWGKKPDGAKYEGREKPLNFLRDYFIKGKNFRKTLKTHFPRGV